MVGTVWFSITTCHREEEVVYSKIVTTELTLGTSPLSQPTYTEMQILSKQVVVLGVEVELLVELVEFIEVTGWQMMICHRRWKMVGLRVKDGMITCAQVKS